MFTETFRQLRQTKWLGVLFILLVFSLLLEDEAFLLHAPNHTKSAASSASVSPLSLSETPAAATTPDMTTIPPGSDTNPPEQMKMKSDIQSSTMAWYEQKNVLSFLTKGVSADKTVEVTATGYYAGVESTGKNSSHPQYGITYSGVKVRRGQGISTIAADLSVFPLGTVLYIPGYGYGIVADVGSAIKGNKIDLYFETKQQVYREWGKQDVKVVVLKKGDGEVTEEMLNRLDEALNVKKTGDTAKKSG